MGYASFSPESTYVSFDQERTHYCSAHKCSTETVINSSRLINKLLY